MVLRVHRLGRIKGVLSGPQTFPDLISRNNETSLWKGSNSSRNRKYRLLYYDDISRLQNPPTTAILNEEKALGTRLPTCMKNPNKQSAFEIENSLTWSSSLSMIWVSSESGSSTDTSSYKLSSDCVSIGKHAKDAKEPSADPSAILNHSLHLGHVSATRSAVIGSHRKFD